MNKIEKVQTWLKRAPEAILRGPGGLGIRHNELQTDPSADPGPQLCRARARAWVHAYAAGGAAYAFVPIPVPGSTTAGLVALEATMVHAISRIYGEHLDARDAAAMVAGFEVAGGALKTLAREGATFIPVIGWAVRSAVAAAAIEGIGNAVIAMFERQHPNKTCL